MEKGVGHHVDADQPVTAGHLEALDPAHRAAGLAGRRAKGREVVLAQQEVATHLHALLVEGPTLPAHPVAQQRGAQGVAIDEIAVVPAQGRAAGVEVRRHRLRPREGHVRGQIGVTPEEPRPLGPLHGKVAVDHLPPGVNPCVRAPRADHPHGAVRDTRQGSLDALLHRTPAGLGLPAGELAPVVLDAECQPQAVLRTRQEARRASNSRASPCWVSLPSLRTSPRMPRAPSVSPMSM